MEKDKNSTSNKSKSSSIKDNGLPRGKNASVDPLPESSRPRKDGPGGE